MDRYTTAALLFAGKNYEIAVQLLLFGVHLCADGIFRPGAWVRDLFYRKGSSAAILRGGRQVLSNIISTQIPIHQKFGGVVPEIASRKHIVNIMPVIDEALAKAGVELADIDQIAVT